MPRKTLQIDLDDWATEELADLRKRYPFFSEAELARLLFEHTLANGDVRAAALAPFTMLVKQDEGNGNGNGEEDVCSGSCFGSRKVEETHDDECPDPCDQTIIDRMASEAKKDARKQAIAQCIAKHEDCICAGGTHQVTSKCTTLVVGDSKFCHYEVKARYRGGTCQRVA